MPTLAHEALATMAQAAAEIERLRAVNAELLGILEIVSSFSVRHDATDSAALEIATRFEKPAQPSQKRRHAEMGRPEPRDWSIPSQTAELQDYRRRVAR
jgi:hypothetical protein